MMASLKLLKYFIWKKNQEVSQKLMSEGVIAKLLDLEVRKK
jgi:hypothetical protein